jgi:hypothetical protein
MSENLNKIFDWAENVSFAVTICDSKGYIIYMNRRSRDTFAKSGSIIGKNLKECHPASAWEKIVNLLNTGESNTYTIEKNGVKKIIHQSPWYDYGKESEGSKPNGNKPDGLVEISIILPDGMPNYIRK